MAAVPAFASLFSLGNATVPCARVLASARLVKGGSAQNESDSFASLKSYVHTAAALERDGAGRFRMLSDYLNQWETRPDDTALHFQYARGSEDCGTLTQILQMVMHLPHSPLGRFVRLKMPKWVSGMEAFLD
jgi:hypothetical protein